MQEMRMNRTMMACTPRFAASPRRGLLAFALGIGLGCLMATESVRADHPAPAALSTAMTSPDATYRSCRRQVRRAAGLIPGKRMRLPRAYHQFVDRCVANGGVYS
jgi:hypothetical protein